MSQDDHIWQKEHGIEELAVPNNVVCHGNSGALDMFESGFHVYSYSR